MKILDKKVSRKDFQSSSEVRWCSGCGDYAVLASVQRSFAEMNLSKEKIVFISGIGCSSRFPYYMDTYGIHSIHGRAPTLASGLKITRPDLSVWIITGDGDCLSIGGNHILHLLRRNININVLLFNNKIYGLTKGQYSPTSESGKTTKSTPFGSVENPLNPISFAIGANASFVARCMDNDSKMLVDLIKQANNHQGTSFIEIYQNCLVFNDGAFSNLTDKKNKNKNKLILENNKPLLFDDEKKGLTISCKNFMPKIIDLEKNPEKIDEVLIHNESNYSDVIAYVLSRLEHPLFPVPFGVFKKVEKAVYDQEIKNQHNLIIKEKGNGSLKDLLYGQDNWIVK